MTSRTLLLAASFGALLGAPVAAATFNTLSGNAPIVIGHRGASAYLPEHSLAAYELAMKMGADYIEPDLQLTKDGVLVAIHDETLDRSTDAVAKWGPGPHRVENYTLAEIKTLRVKPTGPAGETFPGFTPSAPNAFEVPTFVEVLDFLNGYNAANGTTVGVYPEAKTPNRALMNEKIVAELKAKGFGDGGDVFIQSFSFAALADIAAQQALQGTGMDQIALGAAVRIGGVFHVLDTTTGTPVPLTAFDPFAEGLGLFIGAFNFGGLTNALGAEFIAAAHAQGLAVHGWTFRPASLAEARTLFQPFIDAGMDGFFTDNPDLGRAIVAENLPAPVPLPAPFALLAAGLGALVLLRWRATAALPALS
jgi:glycerophosphoryl diester phosphodiesterase